MKPILICLMTILVASTTHVHGLWLFQHPHESSSQEDTSSSQANESFTEHLTNIAAQQLSTHFEPAPQQQEKTALKTDHAGHSHPHSTSSGASTTTGGAGGQGYGSYGSGLFSIAGIQPASFSTLLGTVGDTGFRYFNIQNQCRNRAACDLGAMLYKKLSFVHNWLVRTSVRSFADMNNVYMQSWMEGMTGRNCTAVYLACRQSPLEGLMNLAMLQNLIY